MSRISILDLEQRIDPRIELNKLLSFFNDEPYVCDNYNNYSFIKFINNKISLLPYSGSSQNFDMYWHERGIQLSSNNPTDAILNLISFYKSFTSWLESDSENYADIYEYLDLNKNFILKINNIIHHLLQSLNYDLIYEDEVNSYGFKTPLIVKRDSDVDSVLPLVANSDIRLDLLSYLDFRFEDNLQAKQDILARLYKSIIDDGTDIYFGEPKTEDFRLKYRNELYKRIKQIYNQTNIRHGEIGKIELSFEEKLKYCDMCFYLLLQLIRTPKSIADMQEIQTVFSRK